MKFIKLTTELGDTLYLNPLFIVSMTELSNGSVIIKTMEGHTHIPKESMQEVMKKIKQTELIQWDTKQPVQSVQHY